MRNLLTGFAAGAAFTAVGFSVGRPHAASATIQNERLDDRTDTRCAPEQLEHNRQLVRTFFSPGRSPQQAYDLMTPDYLQHNEGVKRFGQVNGLRDREAFKAIDEILTTNGQRPELLAMPGQPKNEMAVKVIATCDYVTAMHRTYIPDPQNPKGFYTAFDFELWRISDGKLTEHWDSQRIPVPVPELMRRPIKGMK